MTEAEQNRDAQLQDWVLRIEDGLKRARSWIKKGEEAQLMYVLGQVRTVSQAQAMVIMLRAEQAFLRKGYVLSP